MFPQCAWCGRHAVGTTARPPSPRMMPAASAGNDRRAAENPIIAAAVIAGIKIATVARQLGVSRSWASREANASGTRNLIAELLEPHRERLIALFDQTLDVIQDAMKARQLLVVNHVLVDVGQARRNVLSHFPTFVHFGGVFIR